jgi:predicted RNA binding protein YcfA (HicA-like mRNA interferase family)
MSGPERFSVVLRLLTEQGYTLARIRGSHHVFTKPGDEPISVPVHDGKVKPHYVRKIRKKFGIEDD